MRDFVATNVEIVAVGKIRLGIELPETVLRHLKVGLGDELWITEVPGGLKLSPLSPEDTEMM
jgi:hypothetical protein